ncbi:hypothetical protein TNCV_4166171 [Trichonephila clavipes]|nr:hypothetical protein TNCV_4166171 [Trichonephila clavipes]
MNPHNTETLGNAVVSLCTRMDLTSPRGDSYGHVNIAMERKMSIFLQDVKDPRGIFQFWRAHLANASVIRR